MTSKKVFRLKGVIIMMIDNNFDRIPFMFTLQEVLHLLLLLSTFMFVDFVLPYLPYVCSLEMKVSLNLPFSFILLRSK